MKRIASFFLALALAFSLTACTVPVEKADDGKIQIVATLFPYYDFARAIVGDRADVTLLLSGARSAQLRAHAARRRHDLRIRCFPLQRR